MHTQIKVIEGALIEANRALRMRNFEEIRGTGKRDWNFELWKESVMKMVKKPRYFLFFPSY